MGGGPDINYPQQPSYGEGMADAMKAQMEQLLGQGEYAQMYSDAGFEGGNLGDIIRGVEGPIRQQTAQVDTDVLRQTLLGSRQEETTGSYDEEGRLVVGYEEGKEARIETREVKPEVSTELVSASKGIQRGGKTVPSVHKITFTDPKTGQVLREGFTTSYMNQPPKTTGDIQLYNSVNDAAGTIGATTFNADKVESKISIAPTDAVPIYGKDSNGKIIVDKSKIGQTETIPASFGGDGMIDLLGDRRDVQGTRDMTREERLTAIVDRNPAFADQYMLSTQDPNSPFFGDSKAEFMSKKIFAVGGEENLARDLEMNNQDASNLDLVQDEQVFGSLGRQAGFDEQGNFLGLSALAEDIQRGNLSRQREADLADVERLAGRYSDVMEDFKPGTTSGLEGARELLEEQKEAMTTGGGTIDVPTESTFGGRVSGLDALETTVADPLQLQANTQFDQEVGRGQDSLRSALLGDAKQALGQGLTEREEAQIANAARARQTLMGRTFDQSGAIAEAEARVAEDNARRMQNRAFAQSALGQEAGLQQGDITRGMAQESEQAGLQQRADLAQAQLTQQQRLTELDSAQRAQLANQAQQQQANQFGVGATMDAQRLNEQLRQQGLGNYISAVGNLAQIERETGLDPFQALLGRGGGTALQQGQSVFGQAGYGLQSGPQYLNPEAGLGYISQMAANDANMYAANVAADASRSSGIFQGVGNIFGGLLGNDSLFCWVAREVYGPANPSWLQFRKWMFNESPQWFFELYAKYGERFASWISNKPRLKGIIRKWMDSKIGDK